MSTHNIGFYEDLTKIIFELSSNIIKYAPYFFCCTTDDLKVKITDSLLNISKKNSWSKRFQAFNITEFVPVDMTLYDLEKELADLVHGMSLTTTYY